MDPRDRIGRSDSSRDPPSRRELVERALQNSSDVKSVTIHTFVDASKDAYGAVSYLRSEHLDGCINVNIIASKTRVVPLTTVNIPRLELL